MRGEEGEEVSRCILLGREVFVRGSKGNRLTLLCMQFC